MYTENNAITVPQNAEQKFILPDMVDSEFSAEELADDTEGLGLSLNRVKIPSGSLVFEVPTDNPDEPEPASSLVGVILHHHDSFAYWRETDDEGEENLPICSSLDGKTGVGDPGGTCATCPLNVYGTAIKGKGKACKNMRVLYLLRSGEYLPLQLNLPPTSIKPFQKFISLAFTLRNRASWGSLVEIKLKRESNGKETYSVCTFSRKDDFHGEELKKIKAYAKNFQMQIQAANQQRTQANMEQYEDVCEVSAAGALPMGVDDDEPFVINGDREVLPG